MPIGDLAGASIITALSALLSGGMEGLGIGQERRWKGKMREEMGRTLKPDMPYFQTAYLPGYEELLNKLIFGKLTEQYGQGGLSRRGINFNDIFSSGALNSRYSRGG